MAINTAEFAFPKTRPRRWSTQALSGEIPETEGSDMGEPESPLCAEEVSRYISAPDLGQLHHREGRGMGGGKRDDRNTELVCNPRHMKIHNR